MIDQLQVKDIAKVKGGKRLPKGKVVQDEPTPHAYIRVVDMGESGINLGSIKYISEEVHNKLKRYIVSDKDVYISIAGTIGRVGVIPNSLDGANLTENAAKICEISDTYSNVFLSYFLQSHDGQGQIRALTGGTSQPKLALNRIEVIKVPKISRESQDEIVDVVKNYNNLILNNQRRIELLEQAARMIYKEWFVRFRFPGHEHVRLMNGIPEGWQIKQLEEITSVVTKGTTPTTLGKQFTDEGVAFIKVESITESGLILRGKIMRIDDSTHELLARSQLKRNDILFSIAGAIGRVAIVPESVLPANTNQALAIIRCRDMDDVYYLYLTTRSNNFQNYSLGRVVQAAQANVNLTSLKRAPILIPPKPLKDTFNEIIQPIFEQIQKLDTQNHTLSESRDILLPRLMNGTIQV